MTLVIYDIASSCYHAIQLLKKNRWTDTASNSQVLLCDWLHWWCRYRGAGHQNAPETRERYGKNFLTDSKVGKQQENSHEQQDIHFKRPQIKLWKNVGCLKNTENNARKFSGRQFLLRSRINTKFYQFSENKNMNISSIPWPHKTRYKEEENRGNHLNLLGPSHKPIHLYPKTFNCLLSYVGR